MTGMISRRTRLASTETRSNFPPLFCRTDTAPPRIGSWHCRAYYDGTVGAMREMKLHAAGDDSRRAPAIPILYGPEIITMHGKRILFAGLERQGNQEDTAAPMLMQEWSVEIMAEAPAELAQTSHRPPE